MVLGAYVVPYAWRERRYPLLVLVGSALFYLLIGFAVLLSFWIQWDGTFRAGLDGGVRYMLTLYPIGAVLSVIGLHLFRRSDRHWFVKSAVTAMVSIMWLVGVLYQLRGVQMVYFTRQQITRWESALPAQGPIVTDLWWLPAWVAPFFTAHEMYCVRGPGGVADWVVAARARGVDTFTYASFTPIDPGPLPAGPGLGAEAYHFAEGLHVTRFRLIAAEERRGEE
jgi:hypothetical protein